MNSPNVNFQVTNNVISPGLNPLGLLFVMGRSQRGPFNDPSEVVSTSMRFRELYGGEIECDRSALFAEMLLDAGASLRFCRVGNKATIKKAKLGNVIQLTFSADLSTSLLIKS